MDAAKIVADRFEEISSRVLVAGRPANFPRNDRIIWYVVATRCEMDMEGFESVFDQLLTEDELVFLIESLHRLEEPALASAFERAHTALRRVRFYETPGAMCQEYGPELEAELSQIAEFLNAKDLWNLDTKLAALIQ